MKFTTFHQHHQLVAHPQHVPTNGNYNGNSNFPTQTIQVTNQQHFMMPQQTHHHHQQQFYDSNAGSNYVTGSAYSKMTAPLAPHHKQQRSSAIWHQQYTSSTSPMKDDFNGNSNESGWGQNRFDGSRPTSLPPQNAMQQEVSPQLSSLHRMSAESSSESEASGIINKKEGKDKDKKGVFRIFSKKKSKNQP